MIDGEHLFIALRRKLGAASGLPAVAILRDATEEMKGLYMWRDPREPVRLSSGLAEQLRQIVDGSSEGILDGPGLLHALVAADRDLVERLLGVAELVAAGTPR